MDSAPKLTVEKVIKKLNIMWDLKIEDKKTRVFYAWDEQNVPKFIDNNPKYNFYVVDYDKDDREWMVNYVTMNGDIYSITVNDLTGEAHYKN